MAKSFLIFAASITLVSLVAAEALTRAKPEWSVTASYLMAASPGPVFFAGRWAYRSWWILASGRCTDVDICDSGGWLAMTVDSIVGAVASLLVALPAAYLWIRLRNLDIPPAR